MLLHRLCSEFQDQLIKSLSKCFIIQSLFHLLPHDLFLLAHVERLCWHNRLLLLPLPSCWCYRRLLLLLLHHLALHLLHLTWHLLLDTTLLPGRGSILSTVGYGLWIIRIRITDNHHLIVLRLHIILLFLRILFKSLMLLSHVLQTLHIPDIPILIGTSCSRLLDTRGSLLVRSSLLTVAWAFGV